MIYGGDERDHIIQKKVKLVQSGYFKRNIESIEKVDINGISDIISLEYMGSAEFENGSVARSLRRMTINKDFYKVFVFNHYKDENDNPLKVYAPQMFFKNVQSIVDRLVVNGSGLQEYCTLHQHIKSEKKEKDFLAYRDNRNFWWDIENDFFIFFEHTDKILMAMDAHRKNKFGYERNVAKSALSRLYMRALTRPNNFKFLDFNTSIKDYYYDENTQVHFIEFLEHASLENILMEAMTISKVDKGIVRFTINGIDFNIDENTALDILIKENGIDLVDSCTYSNKISELITSYNEEIEKRCKQKQVVEVLKLIRDKKSKQ